jgi:hypothetical protein
MDSGRRGDIEGHGCSTVHFLPWITRGLGTISVPKARYWVSVDIHREEDSIAPHARG